MIPTYIGRVYRIGYTVGTLITLGVVHRFIHKTWRASK